MAHATLHFGKHRGKPLAEVPTSYLEWAIREIRLSSGVRARVAEALAARGAAVPPPPPPRPIPACRRCGPAGHRVEWFVDSLARRRLRATCVACGRTVTFPAVVEPFISEADAAEKGQDGIRGGVA
jgi:hypothetical protein